MPPLKPTVRALCACVCLSVTASLALAQTAPAPDARLHAPSAADAQALLKRAVAAYQQDKTKALAAFSRMGEFVQGDQYVYVLDTHGTLLASGGPSVAFVGEDVRGHKDQSGQAYIQQILDQAKAQGAGSVTYRWLNREHGAVERKVVYFKQVDDAVIVVGQYMPRASAQEAKALLARAVDAMRQDGQASWARFNRPDGGFVQDDLYVYVVGLQDMVMYAHGATPRLRNRVVSDLRDGDGKLFIPDLVRAAKAKNSGSVRYVWLNPVTKRKERKSLFFQRVGEYVLAVGCYEGRP